MLDLQKLLRSSRATVRHQELQGHDGNRTQEMRYDLARVRIAYCQVPELLVDGTAKRGEDIAGILSAPPDAM